MTRRNIHFGHIGVKHNQRSPKIFAKYVQDQAVAGISLLRIHCVAVMSGFGKTLLECREARGLTQNALVKRSGVTQGSISRYEQGLSVPDLRSLVKLAVALGVTVERLLIGEFAEYDLLRQSGVLEQPQPAEGGARDTPETRLLREQVANYRAQTEELHDAVHRLTVILAKYGASTEGRNPSADVPVGGGRGRKARHRSPD